MKQNRFLGGELELNPESKVNGIMETRDHFKNGVSPKDHTSRGNKCSLVILICLFIFSTFSIYAQDSKLKIAVLDFKYSIYEEYQFKNAKKIEFFLLTELINKNKYRVIERVQLEELLKEQGVQSTQMSNAQAVEIGKLLGVNKIIIGEFITGLACYYDGDLGGVTTIARIVNVETGEIEAVAMIQASERRPNTSSKKAIRKKWYMEYCFTPEEMAQKVISELLK